MERNYDSTVARIAGNIMSGLIPAIVDAKEELGDAALDHVMHQAVVTCVDFARRIVAEVKRTAPDLASSTTPRQQ